MLSYIKLGAASCFPLLLSLLISYIDKKFPDWKKNYWMRQTAVGFLFGFVAIIDTEWGIPINGAMVNCRDAAPLTAGFLFGAPAGIIAGIIGGVERWFAVYWGAGSFTRVACSVSTVLAGFYAAAIRKFLFGNKRPLWGLALVLACVMEIFHLTMVFITNMSDAVRAAYVVSTCLLPMTVANGLGVSASAFAVSVVNGDRLRKNSLSGTQITSIIQRWLVICVTVAFTLTVVFLGLLQNSLAKSSTRELLLTSLNDVNKDISDASDDNLLSIAQEVKQLLNLKRLSDIAAMYSLAEINVVDENGIITKSTNEDFVGYNMADGEQSAEFLVLLDGTDKLAQKYGPISYDSSIYRKYAGIAINGGLLQIGYDAEEFHNDIDAHIVDMASNRHVGESGVVFILDKNRNIVSAPDGYNGTTISQSAYDVISSSPEKQLYTSTFNGEPCYVMHCDTEGYYIFAVLPKSEAMQSRDIAIYSSSFTLILIFAILFVVIYALIMQVVVDNIHIVNTKLAQITEGNLDVKVDVRDNAEFASLSDDINMTVDTLKRYIDEAASRLDKELEMAKNIQHSALPSIFPKSGHYEIYARMDTAKEVGGDFYDFYQTDRHLMHILIADVSGKGIPAALFMMRAKTQLKSLTESGLPVEDAFTQGNTSLCEGNDAEMFVTAWQANIDLSTGEVSFANAGHNPPVIKHVSGEFEFYRSRPGLVLGGMDGLKYKRFGFRLEPGDIVFLYTDGVTEATDAHEELYGDDRLLHILNTGSFETMQELCDMVKEDVDSFVGEAPQFDDMTMLAFRYIGA